MALSLSPVSLPHDIQRLIFEHAALTDKRAALKLVLVSRLVQPWIELILYAVVNLHRESTSRAFLRTIETSRTKTRRFFATHVKSLCISYDICNDRTVKIISACRGVKNLTFWVVPSAHPCLCFPHTDIATALTALRPKRLSVLLHDALSFLTLQFHLPFFERMTHLAVVNNWEDWISWSGFELFPRLTHLSFDLRVGPKLLDENKALIISHAMRNFLARCTHIRVFVVLLIFDPLPSFTAASIVSKMDKPDPRLVFLRDTEPFRDREAHSQREEDIWRRAEDAATQQISGSKRFVLEI